MAPTVNFIIVDFVPRSVRAGGDDGGGGGGLADAVAVE